MSEIREASPSITVPGFNRQEANAFAAKGGKLRRLAMDEWRSMYTHMNFAWAAFPAGESPSSQEMGENVASGWKIVTESPIFQEPSLWMNPLKRARENRERYATIAYQAARGILPETAYAYLSKATVLGPTNAQEVLNLAREIVVLGQSEWTKPAAKYARRTITNHQLRETFATILAAGGAAAIAAVVPKVVPLDSVIYDAIETYGPSEPVAFLSHVDISPFKFFHFIPNWIKSWIPDGFSNPFPESVQNVVLNQPWYSKAIFAGVLLLSTPLILRTVKVGRVMQDLRDYIPSQKAFGEMKAAGVVDKNISYEHLLLPQGFAEQVQAFRSVLESNGVTRETIDVTLNDDKKTADGLQKIISQISAGKGLNEKEREALFAILGLQATSEGHMESQSALLYNLMLLRALAQQLKALGENSELARIQELYNQTLANVKVAMGESLAQPIPAGHALQIQAPIGIPDSYSPAHPEEVVLASQEDFRSAYQHVFTEAIHAGLTREMLVSTLQGNVADSTEAFRDIKADIAGKENIFTPLQIQKLNEFLGLRQVDEESYDFDEDSLMHAILTLRVVARRFATLNPQLSYKAMILNDQIVKLVVNSVRTYAPAAA